MEKTKKNMKVIKLNSDEIYRMSEQPTKKWVNYGRDNDYPYYLRNLFTSSPTHQSLINGISYIITSNGLKVDEITEPRAKAFVKLQFTNDLVKKLAFDLKIYGFCVLKCFGIDKCYKVEYAEAIKYRSGVKDDQGIIKTYWYCEDWTNSYKYKPIEYNLLEYNETDNISLYVFQLPKIGYDYYSCPDYISGLESGFIPLEYEIGNFHYNSILNGLAPSMLVNYNNGQPSDEIANEIEKDILKKWGGSSNAGRFILNFNDSKEEAATMETVQTSDLDKQYEFLSRESMEKILISHRAYLVSEIFGLKAANGFANNSDELKTHYSLWYEIVIMPFQKILIDGFQEILEKNMMYAELTFSKYDPFRNPANDVKTPVAVTPEPTQNKLSLSQEKNLINEFEKIKLDPKNMIMIGEDVLINKPKEDKYYRFVKGSTKKSLFLTKMSIESEKGIVYKSSPIIKNTEDYFFEELSYTKKNN